MLDLGSEGGGPTEGYVYHFNGTAWEGPMSVSDSAPFYAVSIVAGSDSDVWVTGASETDAPEA